MFYSSDLHLFIFGRTSPLPSSLPSSCLFRFHKLYNHSVADAFIPVLPLYRIHTSLNQKIRKQNLFHLVCDFWFLDAGAAFLLKYHLYLIFCYFWKNVCCVSKKWIFYKVSPIVDTLLFFEKLDGSVQTIEDAQRPFGRSAGLVL